MKPLKCLVVISWPRTKRSVNMFGYHGKMEMLVTWKRVMTTVLMVMSSMDRHMISWYSNWFKNGLVGLESAIV
jgi:hypothetical protein